jgi:hypothetical protein
MTFFHIIYSILQTLKLCKSLDILRYCFGFRQTPRRVKEEREKEVYDRYISAWGATLGGHCRQNGRMNFQGEYGNYWSLSELDANNGSAVILNPEARPPDVHIQIPGNKAHGHMLRCVR